MTEAEARAGLNRLNERDPARYKELWDFAELRAREDQDKREVSSDSVDAMLLSLVVDGMFDV